MKRRNALVLFAVLTLVLLVLDRITKIIAIEELTSSGPVAFMPLWLDFVLVYNTGGAFGLFEGAGILFVGVAVIAVGIIIVCLAKAQQLNLPVVIALSLVSAGALGNAYDRAMDGAVPDFIHTLFIEFPVFNLADSFLTIGEIFLIVTLAYYWFGPKKQKDVAKITHENEGGNTLTTSVEDEAEPEEGMQVSEQSTRGTESMRKESL